MPSHPEVIKTDNFGRDILMKINVDKIKRVWSHKLRLDQPQGSSSNDVGSEAVPTSVPADAGIANADDDAKAADALALVIEKQDFATMDIIGQFNLGFIIVRRQKQATMESGSQPSQIADQAETILDDLFIVDQHAADEKFNFEDLQSTTKIQSQKLLSERPIWKIVIQLNLIGSIKTILEALREEYEPNALATIPNYISPNSPLRTLRRMSLGLSPLLFIETNLLKILSPESSDSRDMSVRAGNGWKALLKSRRDPFAPGDRHSTRRQSQALLGQENDPLSVLLGQRDDIISL
ncbi:DNA mismatch repair protein PMS1 [Psilocybe cubensis]|uniref:DNA mismatch repair protein PMS1 n=1 Tax=Psilocybe cubensis TaxID=181762 RepID=A0ACB8H1V1_PSICU|nr:DNA mismatch repair protein PMS1 [Psilocybe cubensis]KAH9481883.1 DNA mismatch repair protein PMS1 [Psilocybe cubensis]